MVSKVKRCSLWILSGTVFVMTMLTFNVISLNPINLSQGVDFRPLENNIEANVSYPKLKKRIVKIRIPQCSCSKLVKRSPNAEEIPIADNEITCSKHNIPIGSHQVGN